MFSFFFFLDRRQNRMLRIKRKKVRTSTERKKRRFFPLGDSYLAESGLETRITNFLPLRSVIALRATCVAHRDGIGLRCCRNREWILIKKECWSPFADGTDWTRGNHEKEQVMSQLLLLFSFLLSCNTRLLCVYLTK